MPLVSFLIPVRDARGSLPAALESALAQEHSDFDVVVVDDGSRDGTSEWLAGVQDPRVRVLHAERRGIVAALQAGIGATDAPFLARLDADDVAHPGRLRCQLPHFRDPKIAVVDGCMQWSGEVQEGMRLHAEWINGVREHADFARSRFRECGVVHPAATIRRSALEEVGGYREGDFPEDFDLWLRLHAAGWCFRKVPELVVTMREHEERATRRDPRYRRAAFRSVAERHVAAELLASDPRVALWGGGVGGRPWLRFLRERGARLEFVVDIDPKKIGSTRQGVPVRAPEALRGAGLDLLLVAVGRRDALSLIRAALAELRPEWREGREWFALVCGRGE